jgi:hypothetical protein
MQHYPKQSPVPGIGRPKYQPCASNQRCQYCLCDRACALATESRCVEPLRRNGRLVPEHHPTRTMSPAQPALFPALISSDQDLVSPASPYPNQAHVSPEFLCSPRARRCRRQSRRILWRRTQGSRRRGISRSATKQLRRLARTSQPRSAVLARRPGPRGRPLGFGAVAVAIFFPQFLHALRQCHAFFFRATCPVFGFERLITG